MYTVKIRYADNSVEIFEHIKQISYFSAREVTVSGDALLKTEIPAGKSLNLQAENANHSVSPHNIKVISVFKES